MIKKLHFLSTLITGTLLLFCITAKGQINYTQEFEETETGWKNKYATDFEMQNDGSCSGKSIRGKLRSTSTWDMVISSGTIGTSNGNPATLSYKYKIVDQNNTTQAYPNNPDWGTFYIEYAFNAEEGPWITLETITSESHVESAECAARNVTFIPPANEEIFLRIRVSSNVQNNILAYIFFDNFSVVQNTESGQCTGAPAEAAIVSSATNGCIGTEAVLSFSTPYEVPMAYQWQSSEDGITYTDVADANASTYIATIITDKWYRTNVTCTESGQSTLTSPIKLTSTGFPCYCQITFDNGVEPITHVSFAGIDNSSSAEIDGSPAIEDFTALPPGQVEPGKSYTFSLQGNTDVGYENVICVYIDFNRNGSFSDSGEKYPLSQILYNSTGTDGITVSRNIIIPANTTPGLVIMRIVKQTDALSDLDPCSSDSAANFGQAEEYVLNVCKLDKPVAAATQALCGNATISNLEVQATGGTVVWYATEDGTEAIDESAALVNGTTYYAATTANGCESARTAVAVTITEVPAITGEKNQTFSVATGLPLADLDVNITEGATLSWYTTTEAAEAGETPLANDFVITESGTYYAVQTIGECSSDVFAVTVNVTLATTGFNTGSFRYYPNPVSGILTVSYNNEISLVEVFNLLGQKVLENNAKATSATINMDGLQAGTYLVKVTDAYSNTATVKVIKQ